MSSFHFFPGLLAIEDDAPNCLLNSICCLLFKDDIKMEFKGNEKKYQTALKKGITYRKYYKKIKVFSVFSPV